MDLTSIFGTFVPLGVRTVLVKIGREEGTLLEHV